MGMLNMYGPTVTASEGEESRLYRKTASPSFNDRTHALVWTETIHQVSSMVQMWEDRQGRIPDLRPNLAKMSLHVISSVCFDRKLQWFDDANEVPAKGRRLSYKKAISSMIENTGILFITPWPFLSTTLANHPVKVYH